MRFQLAGILAVSGQAHLFEYAVLMSFLLSSFPLSDKNENISYILYYSVIDLKDTKQTS